MSLHISIDTLNIIYIPHVNCARVTFAACENTRPL